MTVRDTVPELVGDREIAVGISVQGVHAQEDLPRIGQPITIKVLVQIPDPIGRLIGDRIIAVRIAVLRIEPQSELHDIDESVTVGVKPGIVRERVQSVHDLPIVIHSIILSVHGR